MGENTNGATDTQSVSLDKDESRKAYRPTANMIDVYDVIAGAMSRIVLEATHRASTFVSLANVYDKDEPIMVRLDHLVDANECLELAMTHLGQLRAILDYRRRRLEHEPTVDSWSPF